MAKSAMTETVLPPDMLAGLKPELIAPFVGVLTAKNVSQHISQSFNVTVLMTHSRDPM